KISEMLWREPESRGVEVRNERWTEVHVHQRGASILLARFRWIRQRDAGGALFMFVGVRMLLLLLREALHNFGLWTSNLGLNFRPSIRQRALHNVADLRNLIDAHERIHLREQFRQ